jgi:hypothetical protein
VLEVVANFKAEGFKDEREVRIVHSENPDVCRSLSIKQAGKALPDFRRSHRAVCHNKRYSAEKLSRTASNR